MVAIDHQLFVGAGMTAALFINKHPLRPLAENEERVFIHCDDPASGLARRRSVIKKWDARMENSKCQCSGRAAQ